MFWNSLTPPSIFVAKVLAQSSCHKYHLKKVSSFMDEPQMKIDVFIIRKNIPWHYSRDIEQ